MLLWTSRSLRAQRKTVILVCKFLFRIWILFAPPTLLLVHRSEVFKMKKKIIYIFLLIKNLWCDITADNMVFQIFLLSRFRHVFLPTTLASLPPGVMLLNRSTTQRDSATDIEKTSQKGAPEWERPNRRSAVKPKITRQNVLKKRSFVSFQTPPLFSRWLRGWDFWSITPVIVWISPGSSIWMKFFPKNEQLFWPGLPYAYCTRIF